MRNWRRRQPRRKFYDANKIESQGVAAEALARIANLYQVEKRVARLNNEDERKACREDRARPHLDQFRSWLRANASEVLPKSSTGKAIGYALNQWQALIRYLDEGFLAIDNNAAERTLRRIAVGRKNWMFAGSDRGGRWAAVIYTMVASCQRHGVDPFAYLRDVLNRMPTYPAKDINDFLPDAWAKRQ